MSVEQHNCQQRGCKETAAVGINKTYWCRKHMEAAFAKVGEHVQAIVAAAEKTVNASEEPKT